MPKSANSKNSDPSSLQSPESWKYEATVGKIEEIIGKIESGRLELEELFEQFAIATQYLQQCESFLNQRQQQMDLLIETLVDETIDSSS